MNKKCLKPPIEFRIKIFQSTNGKRVEKIKTGYVKNSRYRNRVVKTCLEANVKTKRYSSLKYIYLNAKLDYILY